MRKMMFLTGLAALALPFAASAQTAPQAEGFYVQGDLGLAHLKVDSGDKFKISNTGKEIKNSYKESEFMPRVSVGYDFGNNVRTALDYTHYKDVKESSNGVDMKASVRGVGASVIYDFPVTWPVRPYVGARVAVNKLKATAESSTAYAKNSETKVGVGAMAGVGYQVTPNVALDAGYRFNHIDSDLNAHEASVGVRYQF